jgi:HEAT repeat protein
MKGWLRKPTFVVLVAVTLASLGALGYHLWQRVRGPRETLIGGKTRTQWLAALKDDDPRVGRDTVEALGALGEAAVPLLLEARKDTDLRTHRRAVAALVLVGGPAAPGLVEALPVSGPRAETALVRIGAPAVPALVNGLREPNVAKHAARALGAMGPRAGAAVPDLIGVLQDRNGSAEVRAEAATALGRIAAQPGKEGAPGEDAAVDALSSVLADGNATVRQRAAVALGEIGPRAATATPQLARGVRDADATVSAACCWAIGRLGASGGATALALRLRGEDDPRQRPAAEALIRLGPAARGVIPALVETLPSPRAEGRLAAEVLKRLGPSAVPALAMALKEPGPELRRAAADVLADLGPQAPAALPALLSALEEQTAAPTWPAQIVGLGALPHGPLTSAIAVLAQEDRQTLLPLALARAAVRIDPARARPAIPVLLRQLGGRYGDDAVLSLVELGEVAHGAVPDLLADLVGKDEARAKRAAEVLGRAHASAPEVVPALRAAFKKRKTNRDVYLDALRRLGPAAREAVPDLLAALADRALRPRAAVALVGIDPAQTKDAVRALMPDLEGEDRIAGRLALLALGEMENVPAEALPSLRPLLSEATLVRPALLVIAKMGKEASPAVPDLVGLLSDKSSEVREIAGRALARIGKPAEAAVTTALRSPSPVVRAAAARTMGETAGGKSKGAPFIAPLVAALEDREQDVRFEAAKSLFQLGRAGLDKKAVSVLVGWLDSAETEQRRQAVGLLSFSSPGPEVELRLREALVDPDAEVRYGAALALQLARDLQRDDWLGALHDGSPRVRLVAAWALLKIEREPRDEPLAALLALARGSSPLLRHEAVAALLPADPQVAARALALVEADLRGGDSPDSAADLLVRLDARQSAKLVPWLMARLNHSDAEVRIEAALVLEKIGPPARAAVAVLKRQARQDDNASARAAARRALGKIEAR